MLTESLQKAISALQIADVFLHETNTGVSEDSEVKHGQFEALEIQTKHVVKKSEIIKVVDDGEFFRVYIELGVRWVDSTEKNDDSQVRAYIEACFVAEYAMKSDIDQDCLDEFATKNASYHVWPYWREFLSSQCDRMRLPRIVLPAVQLSEINVSTTSTPASAVAPTSTE